VETQKEKLGMLFWIGVIFAVLLLVTVIVRLADSSAAPAASGPTVRDAIAKEINNPLTFQRYCGKAPYIERIGAGKRDLSIAYPEQHVMVLYSGDRKAEAYGHFTGADFWDLDHHVLTLDSVVTRLGCHDPSSN